MEPTDRELPLLDGVAAGAAGIGVGYAVMFGARLTSNLGAVRGVEPLLIVMVFLGLPMVWLVAAWGVWRRASWGRTATMVLSGLIGLAAVGGIVGRGDLDVGTGSAAGTILTLAASLATIGYLANPDVAAAFD